MTANRIGDFETWVRSVEKRVLRLERRPSASGGAGVIGGGAIGARYMLPFVSGVSRADPPVGVYAGAYVVGSFRFETGEEVGLVVSLVGGVVNIRAAVSDGIYDTTLLFVNP